MSVVWAGDLLAELDRRRPPGGCPVTSGERSLGRRREEDRSDWTEQDLLTTDEAVPRLDQAIAEVTRELEAAGADGGADDGARTELRRRLDAMHRAREAMTRPR